MKNLVGLIFLFTVSFNIQAQNPANALLHKVYANLEKAKDYSVDAHIKVDMPFIRMLPVNVKIYYKQKDKFKVESKSIAIVPRQGFDQIAKILADTTSFTAMVQGEEKLGTIKVSVVNVIPMSDTSDVVLGKFWIEPLKGVVLKSQMTTRANGTIATEYVYGEQIPYGLPDKMIFTVDVKKFKVPKSIAAEMNKSASETKETAKESKRGTITITLTNYIVNKGISDNVFKK